MPKGVKKRGGKKKKFGGDKGPTPMKKGKPTLPKQRGRRYTN